MAFSICGEFSVYGALQKLMYCVPAPLNAALCDKAKFLGFSKFNLFGQSLFGLGKSAFSAQILESLQP